MNKELGIQPQEKLNSGQIVKGIILNAMGFVSQPLYLFPQFFKDKATEHILCEGIQAEDFNDDQIGRVMDKLYQRGLSQIFLSITLAAFKKYGINNEYLHLDSTSISVGGDYAICESQEEEDLGRKAIKIVQGYSRDRRPDLKQFFKKNKQTFYQAKIVLEKNASEIENQEKRAGRLILATNILDNLSASEIIKADKGQQASERGFAFIKDPLFFADSVFHQKPERVETLGMLMALSLLVYTLGQRQLRLSLKENNTGIKNPLGKLTDRLTLRWIFQCFQGIHLVSLNGVKQIVNLTDSRLETLNNFSKYCQKY